MAYVCVHNDHPLRELQVGISVASTEAADKKHVLARAVVDTGATACCIDEDYALDELSVTPVDFVPTQVPGRNATEVRGYFDLTVSVIERVEPEFPLPDNCRPGPIQRILYAVGIEGIPAPQETGTRLFLIGMDLLSSLCFAFQREPSRSVLWLASPLHDEDEDLRRHFLPE